MMKNKTLIYIFAALLAIWSAAGCEEEKVLVPDKPANTDKPSTDTTGTNGDTGKPDDGMGDNPAPEEVPFTLKIYDVTSVMATVEVEPLDKYAPYYMDILPESDYLQSVQYGFDDYMKWFIEHMSETTGNNSAEVIEMISSYGNDGFIVTTLTPETKYYAVAVGIGPDGMTTTEVVSQEFSTLAKVVSENTFEITASDITSSTAVVNVKTSTDDPYILTIEPYSTTMGIDDMDLAEYIIQNNMAWGGLEQITFTGNSEHEHLGKSGWEYEVIAFGYQDGAPTTDVTRFRFTMEDGSVTTDCSFEFKQEFDTFDMYLSVAPSDNSVVYVTNIIATEQLKKLMTDSKSQNDALKEHLEGMIEDMIRDCGTRANVVELISLMGSETFSLKFAYSTEYIQWAVPVDQDGYPTAEFSCSEPFMSPEEYVSPAAIKVKSYKIFNGTLLATLYPAEFKNAKGYAVVDLTVEANSDATTWWSYIAIGDLSKYKKETIIKNVQMAPTQPNMERQFVVAFWGQNTIFGIAQDADGNYGEPLLQVIDISEDKVSPPTELEL